MRKRSLAYDCCHEAGHAVIAKIHGYKIRGVKLRESSDFPWEDVEKGPCIDYELQPWSCPSCHCTVEDRSDAHLLASLNDECSSCRAEKERFVERCSGGDAATVLLQSTEYDLMDSGCDRIQIRQVYPQGQCKQNTEIERGLRVASQIVNDKCVAVRTLRDALVANGTEMLGEEVERIIDNCLGFAGDRRE